MKKKIYTIMALLFMAGAVFVPGCKEDDDPGHNDPSFLVGIWNNTAKGIEFNINSDYTFVCDLEVPGADGTDAARVTGKLDYSVSGLGSNDYLMRNMTTPEVDETDKNYTGNNNIRSQVQGFSNTLIGTLTPSSNKKKFTFTSSNMAAAMFFGGVYDKVE